MEGNNMKERIKLAKALSVRQFAKLGNDELHQKK